jgi:hypothetical protein
MILWIAKIRNMSLLCTRPHTYVCDWNQRYGRKWTKRPKKLYYCRLP